MADHRHPRASGNAVRPQVALNISELVLVLLLVATWLLPLSLEGAPVPADDLQKIQNAAPTEPTVKPAKPRRLLVFTLAKGYIHDATPWGVEALRILGAKTGAYTATPSDDPGVFRLESLREFDAVCFLNTCYTPFTNAVLRQNLLGFVRGGNGYVGIHCSAHTFLDWPEFGRMQGAYSTNHPWVEKITALVEEPDHPLMKCFGGGSFEIADEIYQFGEPYSRDHLRVLMRLDTQRTDMNKPGIFRKDGDFGLVWVRRYGQGRVFYSAFGHEKAVFWNPVVLRHYLAGIQYALGDLQADAAPRGPRASAGDAQAVEPGRKPTGNANPE
jgi:type 1 glutamine amidotransferase